MSGLLASQILIAALGAGWTIIFYLVKRTMRGIDTRLEENSRAAMEVAKNAHAVLAARDERTQRALRRIARVASRHFALIRAEITQGQGELRRETAQAIAHQCGDCGKLFVSRPEFAAFTANMNHKIDSIYEFLQKEERTTKR